MNRMKPLALLACLLLTVCAAHAQEAYTLKLKERGEGDSVIIRKKDNLANKVKVTDGKGGVLVDQNEVKLEISEYRETILKRVGDKRATKLERDYMKLQTKTGDKVADSPLQGKTVVIERVGDKYTFTYKGGEAVPPADAASLVKDFANKTEDSTEMNQVMLPKTPVKVGDTWKLDMKAVFKSLLKGGGDIEVDSDKATGTGKLLKAYKKDGRQFGELNYSVDVPVKAIGKGAQQLKFGENAKMAMKMTLDGCIDGTSEAGSIKIQVTLQGVAAVPGLPGGMATLDVRNDIEGTQEEPTKKK